MKNQKGFSLVELLVVVIIIAIVAAIAIPNLLRSRRAANEASAVSSLRTIHSAQATYFATTGQNSTYGLLEDLGTENLIDSVLGAAGTAARTKSGYSFDAEIGAGQTYCATGDPVAGAGDKFFSVSEDGVIYSQTTAATCSAGALTAGTSAAPIQ